MPWQIAVAVDDGPGLGSRADAGIRQFARENPEFIVRRFPPPQLAAALRSLHFDGLIAQIASPRILRLAKRFGGPVINISGAMNADLPRCTMNNYSLGAMAAGHLCDRGYRSLAYTYLDWLAYSLDRGEGFRRIAVDNGCACIRIKLPLSRRVNATRFRLEEAIAGVFKTLPPNTGLFLAAWPGLSVGTVARLAGRRIPADVAVIVAGDDPLACEAEDVPITTVEYPGEKIGYDAAAMLWQCLRKPRIKVASRLAEPTGVTPRASTGIDAIADPEVRMALQLIRSRFEHPCTVDVLLRDIPVSRSTLERRFRNLLGRTPAEELRSQRLRRAQLLLAQTELPLAEISRRSGFRRPQHLSAVFQEKLQLTPRGYRRQFQLRCDPHLQPGPKTQDAKQPSTSTAREVIRS